MFGLKEVRCEGVSKQRRIYTPERSKVRRGKLGKSHSLTHLSDRIINHRSRRDAR